MESAASKASTLISTTFVKLNLPMKIEEVRFLRGVFLRSSSGNPDSSEGSDPLLHNHLGDSLRYSYPRVQYKCLDGHGGVLVLSHGDVDMPDLVIPPDGVVNIGRRRAMLSLAGVYRAETELGLTPQPVSYLIEDYLPFNQENFARYESCGGLIGRASLIEECLTGNILSLCKGLGVWLEGRVDCSVTDFKQLRPAVFKGVAMARFRVEASVNVALPPLAGLGRGVSHGFGTVVGQGGGPQLNQK